jgi:hypothetical protein
MLTVALSSFLIINVDLLRDLLGIQSKAAHKSA